MKLLVTTRNIEFCDECYHITNRVNRRSGHTVEVVPVCAKMHRRKLGDDGDIHIVPPEWCPLPDAPKP